MKGLPERGDGNDDGEKEEEEKEEEIGGCIKVQ